MAKIVDITEKLDFEGRPALRVKDTEIEVNVDATTVLKAVALTDGDSSPQKMTELYQLLFGEEERAIIESWHLSFKDFITLVRSALSLATGTDAEEEAPREG